MKYMVYNSQTHYMMQPPILKVLLPVSQYFRKFADNISKGTYGLIKRTINYEKNNVKWPFSKFSEESLPEDRIDSTSETWGPFG